MEKVTYVIDESILMHLSTLSFEGDDKDKGEDGTFSMYKTRKHRKKEHGTEELPFDPAATRTLFVGNLEKTLMHSELRKCFDPFGDVVVSVTLIMVLIYVSGFIVWKRGSGVKRRHFHSTVLNNSSIMCAL